MPVITLETTDEAVARFHRMRHENPWAIAGLYRFDDLPKRQPAQTWRTGFPDWNGVALAAGMVSVATGLPGSGKTHLMAQIWNYVVGKYDLVALIASFECAPNPHYIRYLREFFGHCREAEMSEKQLRAADDYIRDHYRFLLHPQETPTLEWFLDMASIAVQREGVKIIQIDPWNRLESQRSPKETEPEYVARCLREVTVFAKNTGCHVQIIAHPAKRLSARRELPPDLEDVAGAMHWWNMPDQGFVIHRKEAWKDGRRCYDATFTHRKSRFEELGYPCVMDVRFNPQSRRFESVMTNT